MKFTSLLVLAGLPAGSAFVAPAKVFHGAGVGAARGSTERSSSCQMMARVPFIAGNWKMNPLDLGTAKDLAKAVSFTGVSLVLGVPDEGQREKGTSPQHTRSLGGCEDVHVLRARCRCAARNRTTNHVASGWWGRPSISVGRGWGFVGHVEFQFTCCSCTGH